MSDTPLLQIASLRAHFDARSGLVKAVDGVDLKVGAGQTVCVVGESGSGKSVTARSILGLVDPPGRIVSGEILWQPDPTRSAVDLAAISPEGEQMRRIRGAEIGMVFQEPMASLSPMYTVGEQLIEAIRLHRPMPKKRARQIAVDQLGDVGIPRPQTRIDSYPFELSGGMCQRAMIAIALCNEPALLIADEPTTALDVTTQARILDLLRKLQADRGMSIMFITHDLGVVAEMADEVAVMYLGNIVERGPVRDLFDDPRHPYTQGLLASIPALGERRDRALTAIRGMVPPPSERPVGCVFHTRCPHVIRGVCDTVVPEAHDLGPDRWATCHLLADDIPDRVEVGPPTDTTPAVDTGGSDSADTTSVHPGRVPAPPDDPATAGSRPQDDGALLRVRDLTMVFDVKKGFLGRVTGQVRAVTGVDIDVQPGETVGLVGESGCGKTTLGRCIARDLTPTSGTIEYRDETGNVVDLAGLSERQLLPYRSEVRVIYQDPFSSLNPRKTLLDIIGEPLRRIPGTVGDSSLEDRVAAMLRRVGLRPEYLRRYPHEFSGGERQRINIARALITRPRLVVADEAVSALDVSIRAQILNLLRDLQDELGLSYLFISHDLSVVEYLCDRVAVMYLGSVVEEASAETLFTSFRHPYTEALMAAVPVPDPHRRDMARRVSLAGELPDPAQPPDGCTLHTRCRHAVSGLCDQPGASPPLARVGTDHRAACLRVDELTLSRPQEQDGGGHAEPAAATAPDDPRDDP